MTAGVMIKMECNIINSSDVANGGMQHSSPFTIANAKAFQNNYRCFQ